jgi:hypothetical protein
MKISHYLLAGIAGLLITPSIFVAHCQNPEYCLSLYQTMKDSCVTQYQTCVADHEANCTARDSHASQMQKKFIKAACMVVEAGLVHLSHFESRTDPSSYGM